MHRLEVPFHGSQLMSVITSPTVMVTSGGQSTGELNFCTLLYKETVVVLNAVRLDQFCQASALNWKVQCMR